MRFPTTRLVVFAENASEVAKRRVTSSKRGKEKGVKWQAAKADQGYTRYSFIWMLLSTGNAGIEIALRSSGENTFVDFELERMRTPGWWKYPLNQISKWFWTAEPVDFSAAESGDLFKCSVPGQYGSAIVSFRS